jgi:hypothetical protein
MLADTASRLCRQGPFGRADTREEGCHQDRGRGKDKGLVQGKHRTHGTSSLPPHVVKCCATATYPCLLGGTHTKMRAGFWLQSRNLCLRCLPRVSATISNKQLKEPRLAELRGSGYCNSLVARLSHVLLKRKGYVPFCCCSHTTDRRVYCFARTHIACMANVAPNSNSRSA